ncbi:MAG: hypothetical protein H7067_03960 [Burkholderiales bacterium]|nr:hypothetical protein [Opitutaceae bacterium]
MNINDCDLHPAWADPHEITKRLPVYFREAGGFGPVVNDWRNPFGFPRMDACCPDGTDPDASVEHFPADTTSDGGVVVHA